MTRPSKIKLNSDNLKFSLNILKFREWIRCPLRPLRPLQSQSNFIREKKKFVISSHAGGYSFLTLVNVRFVLEYEASAL